MHGAGNDFIIVDNRYEKIAQDDMSQVAKALCSRRISVGADGVMFLEDPVPGSETDCNMLFYNADGNPGEMCGNGTRCVCRFAWEHGFCEENSDIQRIQTPAGIVTGQRLDKENYRIRLNDISVYKPGVKIIYEGKPYICDYLEMGLPGLPHTATRIKGLAEMDKEDLRSLGKYLRAYPPFVKGANVDFYDITGPNVVELITYERYVEDFTFACGTGTGCVSYLLAKRGQVDPENIKVHVPGGWMTVDIEPDSGNGKGGIFLSGATEVVYDADTPLF